MRSVTFTRDDTDDDWEAVESGETISICSSEFYNHLDLEPEALTFEAVFFKTEPDGEDYFKLIHAVEDCAEITLETEEYLCFYESATALMNRMHAQGYRYLKVET